MKSVLETLNLLIELAPALAEMVEEREKGVSEAKGEPLPDWAVRRVPGYSHLVFNERDEACITLNGGWPCQLAIESPRHANHDPEILRQCEAYLAEQEAKSPEPATEPVPPPLLEDCKELAGHPWLCVNEHGDEFTRERQSEHERRVWPVFQDEMQDMAADGYSLESQAAVKARVAEVFGIPTADTTEVDRLKRELAAMTDDRDAWQKRAMAYRSCFETYQAVAGNYCLNREPRTRAPGGPFASRQEVLNAIDAALGLPPLPAE